MVDPQPSLFDTRTEPTKRRHRTQRTSIEAYYNLRGLSERQQRVYDLLKQYGPRNDKEIAAWLGWVINATTPRRNELCRLGLVVSTGERRGGGLLWRAVE